ncbi:MAG: UvrD-helicase domain-containing protein, partial [Lachnospiraceae bacterium]|nr:UvrD-helicase domain-containing protein [Lachnospiraceae bacterium]
MRSLKMLQPDNLLNESQRRAVTCASGENLLVVAGPGSGKTFVITQRIFYLIQMLHVPPEKILAVTFTKDAALSMQKRFLEKSDLFYPVNFGTFHSVFYNIYRQSRTVQPNILTQKQKSDIMLPVLKKCIKEHSSEEKGRELYAGLDETSRILAAISYYKSTGDEREAENKLSAELRPFFKDCYIMYERERSRRRQIDFDDMLCESCRLLYNDEALRRRWQKCFEYILIDEFQDINPVQMSGIGLLKGENCSLFAVGDDDQAI